MAWIESHQELKDHPKVSALCGDMDWEVDLAIGKLHRFWWWSLSYAIDGDLSKFNDGQIAAGMGVAISEGKRLVEAMVKSRWIDREPYFRVHDWWDYVGAYLKTKWKDKPEKWKAVQLAYSEKLKERETPEITPPVTPPVTDPVTPPATRRTNQPTNQPTVTLSPREDFAEIPSLPEVQTAASAIGLAAWKAEAWFNDMEGCGWTIKGQRVRKWRSILNNVKTYWEADGRPMKPPGRNNGTGKNQQSVTKNPRNAHISGADRIAAAGVAAAIRRAKESEERSRERAQNRLAKEVAGPFGLPPDDSANGG